jgi:tetratricopeptide (TPR) repeat protein
MFIKTSIFTALFTFFVLNLHADEFSLENIISLIETNKPDKALTLIENLSVEKELESELFFMAGQKYFLKKNYEKSLFCFEKADSYKNKEILEWNKGLCFFALKRYDKAFYYLEKNILSDSSEEEILLAANAGYMSRNYEKALVLLEKKDFSDKKEEKLNLKSEILFFLKNYEKSLEVLEELLKVKPYNNLYFNNYIKVKKALKKDTKADIYMQKIIEKDYEALLNLNEKNSFLRLFYYKKLKPKNYYQAAGLYYNLCLYDEALDMIEKIKNPDFDSNFLKARILFIKGEYEKSAGLFLSLAKLNIKDFTRLNYFAGEAFLMAKRYEKAIETLSLCTEEKSPFSKEALKLLNILKEEI